MDLQESTADSRGQSHVVVIGLGYVGLPLVVELATAGRKVVGLDRNADVVASLRAGKSHVDDIPDQAIQQIAPLFSPTTDVTWLSGAEVIVVCVPTPLSDDGAPDLGAVRAAGMTIGEKLRSGTLVILESTTYPGTTEEFFRPLLEVGGLRVGDDFNLAFSPERVDPGNSEFGIKNTPKVVGGVTEECTARAVAFYSEFIDTVVPAKGTREAEMAKLLENTYRHINIALVNEMAKFSHELGVDLWNVIDCAKTKPFGFQAFYPGPGVGGHCIPIDPNYLSHTVRARLGYPFRFVELAQEVNASMPSYVVRRIQDRLNDKGKSVRGSSVLLLGVTYKANIADERESPAVPIAARLLAMGASLSYHDPFVSEWNVSEPEGPPSVLHRADCLEDAMDKADLIVLLQAHRDYRRIPTGATPVLDTRGVLNGPHVERL
jgi:nucleotide sugar dehydrogenase